MKPAPFNMQPAKSNMQKHQFNIQNQQKTKNSPADDSTEPSHKEPHETKQQKKEFFFPQILFSKT